MPTTTLSAGDEALAEEAVNVDVAAATTAAEARNERREVSAEVCVMSEAPIFQIGRVNLRESHLHAGRVPDCGNPPQRIPGMRVFRKCVPQSVCSGGGVFKGGLAVGEKSHSQETSDSRAGLMVG